MKRILYKAINAFKNYSLNSYLIAVGCGTLFLIIQSSELKEYLDARINRPFLFHTREYLGKSPPLNQKIKIISFDDASLARLQTPEIPIDDWTKLLLAVDKRNPKVVLIDKIFSIVFDPYNRAENSFKALFSIRTPIFIGSFVKPTKISERDPYSLDNYLSPVHIISTGHFTETIPDRSSWFLYGPTQALQGGFFRIGHINYDFSGLVDAMFKIGENKYLPYIGLAAKYGEINIGEELIVSGDQVPTTSGGRIMINFSTPKTYFNSIYRLEPILRGAKKGLNLDFIGRDDVVLILPNMFTGSTDFIPTPFGELPGGFSIAAIINSVLSKQWLKPLEFGGLQILLAVVVGVLITLGTRTIFFWILLPMFSAMFLFAVIYAFSYQRIAVSWILPLGCFLLSAISKFAFRSLYEEKKKLQLMNDLNDADEMAKAFRPDLVPDWFPYGISLFHRPISRTSGDWFAFSRAPSKNLYHFFLCDIIGHGVQSALVISTCKTLLNFIKFNQPEKLDETTFIMTYANLLNNLLFEQGEGKHLVTYLGITFEPAKNVIHYTSAGHPPPLFFEGYEKKTSEIKPLVAQNNLLGFAKSFGSNMKSCSFEKGNEIITFTDGVPLIRNQRLVKAFIKKANAILLERKSLELFQVICTEETKKRQTKLNDDVTIIWFRAA